VTLRIARLSADEARAHREALAEVLADCVNGGASVSFMWPFNVADAARWWDGVIADVARERTVLLAGFVDGRLLGTVQLGMDMPPNQPHRGDVKKMLVHRDGRRRGLARALMLTLEDEAKARGRTLLVLDTASAEAEALYRSLGYRETGVIPNYALYPDGRFCDTIVFWKALA
jgi:ribosomal protein S18 acetylase RimI-like enzyme